MCSAVKRLYGAKYKSLDGNLFSPNQIIKFTPYFLIIEQSIQITDIFYVSFFNDMNNLYKYIFFRFCNWNTWFSDYISDHDIYHNNRYHCTCNER